jgi:hypothetical protein
MQMSKGIVRDSKYRHVFGKAANKVGTCTRARA